MVIVLISARYKRIIEWLSEESYLSHIGMIKQTGPKIYLYVESSYSLEEVIQLMNKSIKDKSGGMLVYQLYTIYNGKIDYNAYLPCATKNQMSYYLGPKDITDEEIQCYKENIKQ